MSHLSTIPIKPLAIIAMVIMMFQGCVTPPDKPAQTTHTVKLGETRDAIAKLYEVHPDELMRENQLTSEAQIYPGVILKIPPRGRGYTTGILKKTKPIYHTVHHGETLYRIGQRYRVSVSKLKKWNNIRDERNISIGRKLIVGYK